MNSQERLETALSFREPDRVPIELHIDPRTHKMPEARRLVEFIETEADNFLGGGGVDWGFLGLPAAYREEIIEDRPGEYRRIKRTMDTAAGPFVAITKHNYPHLDSPDYHWEQRYINTLDDFARMADAPRQAAPFDKAKWDAGAAAAKGRGVAIMGLLHPLGRLVRQADMEGVYGWLMTEKEITHRFLARTAAQVAATVEEIGRQGAAPWFVTYAHEMLIPPWLGMRHFDELVFPYDKTVNDAIHRIGGRLRAHCHGNCMGYLERMCEMGVDSIEPLEAPPFGDVDLAEAKRRMAGRMSLSGNIPSQDFNTLKPADVRRLVKEAIAAAAPGGGFTLRTTGGHASVDADLEPDVLRHVIANVEAYIEAGLEYGRYPIRM